jgi:hypothetical protein
MHMFIKLPRPVDIASPLESEFAIIPTLFVGQYNQQWTGLISLCRYKDPAGPTPGSPAAEISGDPAGM